MEGTNKRREPSDTPNGSRAATDSTVPRCTCMQGPFAILPPELRPRPASKKDDLRRVTCPGCGLVYSTNRKTDLCMECERKLQ